MTASRIPHLRCEPGWRYALALALALAAPLPLAAATPVVRLASPNPYANYRWPTNLLLRAEVSSWEDALWRLEFRVDAAPLAALDAPPFEWVWTNAPTGQHTLAVRLQDRSGFTIAESPPVNISVFLQNNLPMISILAEVDQITEQGHPGILLVWRADDHLERPLDVQVAYGMAEGFPMAENGADFQRLPSPVTFAPGAAVVRLPVYALNDGLLEGPEAFTAALVPGPGYGLSAHTRAVVSIADAQVNAPTRMEVLLPPGSASSVPVGVPTPITVVLLDPDRLPHQVSLRADGRLLARAEQVLDRVTFTPTFTFPGEFTLIAEAADRLGLEAASAPVALRSRFDNTPPYVRFTAPLAHVTLPRPETTLEAMCADPDDRVRLVEFWDGTNRLGTVETPAPGTRDRYRLAVSRLVAGLHVFRAHAIDGRGARGSSAPLRISVLEPLALPPGIRLAEQPLSRSSFALGARGVLFQWDFLTPRSGNVGVTNPVPADLPPETGALAEFAPGVNPGLPISNAVAREISGEAVRWDGRYGPAGRVTRPPTVTAWRSVTAGLNRYFAIGDDGELYAWGDNRDGGLGLGADAPSSTIVTQALRVPRPAEVRAWTQVTATSHTLAVDLDGRLFAWGLNSSGQLGLGANVPSTGVVRSPAPVASPEGVRWRQVAAGSGFSLGLTTTGAIYAWGNNESGQLGIGRLLPQATSPHLIPLPPGAEHWTRLAAGANHGLAMTDDASLYAWGANLHGQAGVFPDPPPPWPGEFRPRRIEWPSGVAEWLTFTGGTEHSLAVADDARVFRWGKTTSLDRHHEIHPVPGASREVLWNVETEPAEPSFVRHLPSLFAPGLPLTVLVVARPPINAAAWALEDMPPVGWTVTDISDDGVFDPVKGKVRFGPFYHATHRTLAYRTRPPTDATHTVAFLGTASIDGTAVPMTGDLYLRPAALHHPADQPPGDFLMEMGEVTAYASAWRRGTAWPIEPNPIPMDYVTRAGWLWRSGEIYRFDSEAGDPPLCWTSGEDSPRSIPGGLDFPVRGSVTRSFTAGPPWRVAILVEPAAGVACYAVEEQIPSRGHVDRASHEAAFDSASRRLRWGPFHDDTARQLLYVFESPPDEAGPWLFQGAASFDGGSVPARGDVTPPATAGRPWLAAEIQAGADLQLVVAGTAQGHWILETSTNATEWIPWQRLPPGTGLLRLPADQVAENERLFYRLRSAD